MEDAQTKIHPLAHLFTTLLQTMENFLAKKSDLVVTIQADYAQKAQLAVFYLPKCQHLWQPRGLLVRFQASSCFDFVFLFPRQLYSVVKRKPKNRSHPAFCFITVAS